MQDSSLPVALCTTASWKGAIIGIKTGFYPANKIQPCGFNLLLIVVYFICKLIGNLRHIWKIQLIKYEKYSLFSKQAHMAAAWDKCNFPSILIPIRWCHRISLHLQPRPTSIESVLNTENLTVLSNHKILHSRCWWTGIIPTNIKIKEHGR